jgi:hypothetical protein
VYQRAGDRAKAEQELATASVLFRAMDMGNWLARCEAEMRRAG